MKKAIIAMCTGKKYRIKKFPALFLYAAAPWSSIRNYLTKYDFEVYVVSAKYGLIPATAIIDYYEQTMTTTRIQELKIFHADDIKQIVRDNDKIFFFLSEHYKSIVPEDIDKSKCTFMAGGLIKSLSALKKFITEVE